MMRDLFGNTVKTQECEITADNGMLVVKTPYAYQFVTDFKQAIPSSARRWDPARKTWLVDPQHGKWLVKLIDEHFGETVSLPAMKAQNIPEIRLLEIHYIGRCKDRNGEKSAFGMLANGEWGAILPEQALRDWFEVGDIRPGEQSSLYSILGVPKTADPDSVKTAYRKMAKAWHPDLNKGDPDAAEQFMRIQQAWEILSSAKMRARYDAGLALEASLGQDTQYQALAQLSDYRSPLRCGWIMAEGVDQLGRFVISKILEWQDIINPAGQTLVVSWPAGAKFPTRIWA